MANYVASQNLPLMEVFHLPFEMEGVLTPQHIEEALAGGNVPESVIEHMKSRKFYIQDNKPWERALQDIAKDQYMGIDEATQLFNTNQATQIPRFITMAAKDVGAKSQQVQGIFTNYPLEKVLIIDFENATSTGDAFRVPDAVRQLSIVGKHLTSIGGYFLANCTRLQQIDLTPLNHITSIRDGFLSYCSGLQQIDLTPFNQVTRIGEGFLTDCSGLQQIDLTPLNQITSIGDGFLSDPTLEHFTEVRILKGSQLAQLLAAIPDLQSKLVYVDG